MTEYPRPDCAARRIICAAYLYYQRASPIISDAAYDQMSEYVAANWDWLEPIRQFQLGSPRETRAGGSHIKITQMGEDAAIAKYMKKFGRAPGGPRIPRDDYQIIQPWGCYFASLGG